MTLCPGSCDRVFEAIDKPIPGKVECELCHLKFWQDFPHSILSRETKNNFVRFSFQCSLNYHAPASCDIMRNWLNKCRDVRQWNSHSLVFISLFLQDSETANYISANTKDCPKCKVCIEKNGGKTVFLQSIKNLTLFVQVVITW